MNILYYSVHAILEDDDIRLLKALGHNICCLGCNTRDGQAQNFRPRIVWNEKEVSFYDSFETLGGSFSYGASLEDINIPEEFVRIFDCVIVMHDLLLVKKFWLTLSQRPVFWRTIGQRMEEFEAIAAPLRAKGMAIIRYSPTESSLPNYLGQDAVIRFSKSSIEYGNWTGRSKSILMFSNLYKQRYLEDYLDYIKISVDLPMKLGGYGNSQYKGAIGLKTPSEQQRLYRTTSAYLYASGLGIPYTLNFIEAWMSGAPMVVYAPSHRISRYFEIDKLIDHGLNGFICRNIQDARQTLNRLLHDRSMAQKVSEAGRARAIELFSVESIAPLWTQVLLTVIKSRNGC